MDDPPHIYLDGVFDLFHVSHLSFLYSVIDHAKKELKCPIVHIVCGVISDKDAATYKRVPIWNETQRARMVKHCTLVHKVIENSPLVLTDTFLQDHRISLVYHADDSAQETFFKCAIDKGIMRYIPYHNEISTTQIIETIQQMK